VSFPSCHKKLTLRVINRDWNFFNKNHQKYYVENQWIAKMNGKLDKITPFVRYGTSWANRSSVKHYGGTKPILHKRALARFVTDDSSKQPATVWREPS
jgi:hypothetical protein